MRSIRRNMQSVKSIVLLALIAGCGGSSFSIGESQSALDVVANFGSNPGNLTMNRYVPKTPLPSAPLVVALHGCGQTAADYQNAGWNDLADANGFYVLYPEQKTANNLLSCFDWVNPPEQTRGMAENESIKEMIDKMKSDFTIDGARVFVTGLSAGAAETNLMLATWPDVFAAGASLSGMPYACATTLLDSLSCASPGKDQTASAWGDLVRAADSGFTGARPRVILWQGAADQTVNPLNLTQLIRQWTNVLGVSDVATSSTTSGIVTHQLFQDSHGVTQVESYSVAGMDHGVALDPKNGCGTAGAYFLDVGVCSTRLIAEAFGIVPSSTSVPDGGVTTTDGSSSVSDGATAPTDGPSSPNRDAGSSAPSQSGCSMTQSNAAHQPNSLTNALLFLLCVLALTLRKLRRSLH